MNGWLSHCLNIFSVQVHPKVIMISPKLITIAPEVIINTPKVITNSFESSGETVDFKCG